MVSRAVACSIISASCAVASIDVAYQVVEDTSVLRSAAGDGILELAAPAGLAGDAGTD